MSGSEIAGPAPEEPTTLGPTAAEPSGPTPDGGLDGGEGREPVAGPVDARHDPRARFGRASFRTDVAHTTATNVVIAGCNVLTGILVARLLNPYGRGELAAIMNWPSFLGVMATLGLTESLVYFTAREPRRAGHYLGSGVVVTLSASAVLAAVGWVLMPVLLAAQAPDIVTAARWYLLQVPIAAVVGLACQPLRGVGDMRAWNALRTAPTLLWVVVVVGFAIRGGRVEPQALAISFVALRLLLIPVSLLVTRHRLRQNLRPQLSLARPLLRFGIPSVLASMPTMFNVRLDQLVIAAVLPAGALGLYVVAVSWSLLPSAVMLAFGSVLFPRVAEIEDVAQRNTLAVRGVRTGVLLSAVLTLGTLVLTPVAIPLLFGARFADVVPAALVLTVASGIFSVNGVQEEAMRGLGKPVAVLWAQLAGLVVTVVGLVLTVPDGRLVFIAFASVAGYTTLALVLGVQIVRLTGHKVTALLVPRRADLVAARDQLRRRRAGTGAPT